MSGTPADEEEERREEGRRMADALRAECQAAGDPSGWFDACYRAADGDPWLVPWGHQIARPELVDWVKGQPVERLSGKALDIACGLGDNAAFLAQSGFDVTAFDISDTAVEWAAKRFPDLAVEWRAADLLDTPPEWRRAFALVNETYTLQALRPPFRDQAINLLADFVAPGGTLLIIGRGRHADEPLDPPPWPLLREELVGIARSGLEEVLFEDFLADRKGRKVRHFRAKFRRPL